MNTTKLISVSEFCEIHQIDITFIQWIENAGLAQINTIQDTQYIPEDELKELESIVSLYRDMDVNPEGIEIIRRLVKRIDSMYEEIIHLRNRLEFYE